MQNLTVGEIVIKHLLWETPDDYFITPDGKSLYFIVKRELHVIRTEYNFHVYGNKDDIVELIRVWKKNYDLD